MGAFEFTGYKSFIRIKVSVSTKKSAPELISRFDNDIGTAKRIIERLGRSSFVKIY